MGYPSFLKLGSESMNEVREYKYLGVMVRSGTNGGLMNMKERIKDARGVIGMVKYAAKRSGCKFILAREGWKSLVVNKLMYGAGALVWKQSECDDLDVLQNDIGRWMWNVGMYATNASIRGETGWSTFKEREAKVKLDWFLRIIFEDSMLGKVGKASLGELGAGSNWWPRVRWMCDTNGMNDLGNVISLGYLSDEGLRRLGMNGERKGWKEKVKGKVEESGRKRWRTRLEDNVNSREYVRWKKVPGLERYADGSSGAKVRMLLRGGCLPVRNSERMNWKFDDKRCICGEIESVGHVFQECAQYQEERGRWKDEMGNVRELDLNEMKGYTRLGLDEEERMLSCMGNIWNKRVMYENKREGN